MKLIELEIYENLLKDKFKIEHTLDSIGLELINSAKDIVYEKYKDVLIRERDPKSIYTLSYKLEKIEVNIWSNNLTPVISIALEYFCVSTKQLSNYQKNRLKKLKIEHSKATESKKHFYYSTNSETKLFISKHFTVSLRRVLENNFYLEL